MCRVMDELRKEAVQERNYEIAIKMLNDKDVTDEKISEFTGIAIEEIQKLRKELHSWFIKKGCHNIMDKIIEELVRETRYEIVETLLKMKKLTKEEIARAAENTVKEVEELEKENVVTEWMRFCWTRWKNSKT